MNFLFFIPLWALYPKNGQIEKNPHAYNFVQIDKINLISKFECFNLKNKENIAFYIISSIFLFKTGSTRTGSPKLYIGVSFKNAIRRLHNYSDILFRFQKNCWRHFVENNNEKKTKTISRNALKTPKKSRMTIEEKSDLLECCCRNQRIVLSVRWKSNTSMARN